LLAKASKAHHTLFSIHIQHKAAAAAAAAAICLLFRLFNGNIRNATGATLI